MEYGLLVARGGVAALIGALLHPEAQKDENLSHHHRRFVAQKLLLAGGMLAATPFLLAFQGAPDAAETVGLCVGLASVFATTVLSRWGRAAAAHGVMAASLAGTTVAMVALGQLDLCGAAGWLLLVQVEGSWSGSRRLARTTAVGIVGLVFGFAALSLFQIHPQAASWSTTGLTALGLGLGVTALLAMADEIRRLRSALEATAARCADMESLADELYLQFDSDSSIVDASASWADRDLARGALLGSGLFDRVHVGDRPAFLKLVADARHGDEMRTGTFRLRVAASEPRQVRHIWVEMRARRIAAHGASFTGRTVARGEADRVGAVLRDISPIREQLVEIERAHAQAEKAIRSKDDFLTNVSHELRTPLNAIIGFSEMLGSHTLRPSDPAKQREYAQIINQSGQHLLAVVNSILDMSKLQSGTFAILPEPFALAPLVTLCCDMVSLKAEEGRVRLLQEVPSDLCEIVADKRACKQVILNLLSNAVKFTPAFGAVTIRARLDGTGLRLEVSDTGIGIAQADLGRLGDPFFQARSSICRPYEGTGLGLSVVRGLVGLHGGTIEIGSEPGKGTTVAIRLPLDCRGETASAAAATIETTPLFHPTETKASGFQTRIRKIA